MSKKESYFWKNIPSNTLSKSSYGSPKSLKYTRIAGFIFSFGCSIWEIVIDCGEDFYPTFSYLTAIGCYFCALYFGLVLLSQHDPDNRLRWKLVYALGEVTVALETLIAPFFWFAVFKPKKADAESILYGILLHAGLTIFMWAEAIQNQMVFPPRHRWFLVIVGISYLVDNLLFTMIREPVYSVITWKNWQSYVYILIAIILAFAGYEIGGCQYRRKLRKNKIQLNLSTP